ncbi:hypothetical protein C8F04DRAFT_337600 [Mycena alexandri]|uniref:Uncharacterized protein n=1 Tax=Mycena alexandri TaxID=1745969 RepID=A0AAD6S2X5_9AGAR|nr:hypothetical protein C8F04DRAFT_337600 [Mycena alexandri]
MRFFSLFFVPPQIPCIKMRFSVLFCTTSNTSASPGSLPSTSGLTSYPRLALKCDFLVLFCTTSDTSVRPLRRPRPYIVGKALPSHRQH